ncbi:hypothetical protein [Schlesneria paludicola]|uniref:hypothetical protein n=1 Tax=Schlesneria paludicola TaxID=360056 RepID=UPI000299D7FC|nr:hypothetical protein [Schlesneria paludicola]
MRSIRFLFMPVAIAWIAGVGSNGLADDAATPDKSDVKPKTESVAPKTPGPADAKEEAAVEFVQRNHPALVPLLQALKSSSPKEHGEAIAALNKDIDRLNGIRDKNPQRYAEQLAEWKLTSRIRLLGARFAVSEDKDIEAELKAALRERVDLKLATAKSELDRLKKREKKLNSMIDEFSDKDKQVAKEMAQLKSARPVSKGGKKNLKTPASAGQVDAKGDRK